MSYILIFMFTYYIHVCNYICWLQNQSALVSVNVLNCVVTHFLCTLLNTGISSGTLMCVSVCHCSALWERSTISNFRIVVFSIYLEFRTMDWIEVSDWFGPTEYVSPSSHLKIKTPSFRTAAFSSYLEFRTMEQSFWVLQAMVRTPCILETSPITHLLIQCVIVHHRKEKRMLS
jgi:hypothetical protein